MTFSEAKLEYWKAVDWTKPRSQIMEETDCSIGTILNWYSRIHGVRPSYVVKKNEALDALDWSKTDSQLFRETRINLGTIRNYRIRNHKGMPTQRPENAQTKVTTEQVDAANWELETDRSLSFKWRISRERVRQLRIKHNKPACLFQRLSTPKLAAAKWVLENRASLEGKHIHEITRAVPSSLPLTQIREMIKRLGITYLNGETWKHSPLGQYPINYELPNVVLTLVWGLNSTSIQNTRCVLKFGPSKWFAGGGFSRFWEKSDFQEALEIELKKAEQHGKTNARVAIEEYLASKRRMAVRRMQPEEPLAPYP